MKADNEVRRDVEAELRWSPELDDKDIAVKVSDGVVTLTGFVGHLRSHRRLPPQMSNGKSRMRFAEALRSMRIESPLRRTAAR